jgi:hypothetical protein
MTDKPNPAPRVIDLKPRTDHAVKPAELIQITGHQSLTLNARRSITILWHNAHSQGVAEGKDYVIEIDDLKPDDHKGYEMVEEAIIALMRTILTIKLPDGRTRRVQFLGGNDLDDPDRPGGTLSYSPSLWPSTPSTASAFMKTWRNGQAFHTRHIKVLRLASFGSCLELRKENTPPLEP